MVRRTFVRGGSRRATVWIASTVETALTTLAATASVLDQTFTFAEDGTIVRTRGTLFVRSDQIAATESVGGALGMAVVTDQAAAIGVTAVPTPITDQASDNWFLWLPWAYSFVVTTAVGTLGDSFARYDFDSKAMRKVNSGDSVAVVLENGFTTFGVEFFLTFRMLVKARG